MRKEFTFKFFGKTWKFIRKPITGMVDEDGSIANGSAIEDYAGNCELCVMDDLRGEKLHEVLIHELFESAIATVGGVYIEYGAGTQDRIFVFDHKQFSTICGDIASAYAEICKKLGGKDAA